MGVGSQLCKARSHPRGLRSDPRALGSGAHIRLDLWQPPGESRLRVAARNWRGTDLRDDDPADAQEVGERSRMRATQTPSQMRGSGKNSERLRSSEPSMNVVTSEDGFRRGY